MIRFKVFIPVLILVGLVSWGILYKLDYWVKGLLEEGISSITDTKTDIRGLEVSLLNSSLKIKNLQVGSSEDEFKNTIEFNRIAIDFQALPLLKKRFVVDEFSITGVAWDTPRETSAKLPPKPKSEPSWLSKELAGAMGSLKTEFANLPVAKITDFKMPSSTSDVLRELDLASEKEYKNSISLTQGLRSDWQIKLKELRDISEYEKRMKDARGLVKGAPNDAKKILERVKTIKSLISFLDSEKKKANDLATDIRSDYEKIDSQYKAAIAAVDSDYKRASDLISLDQLSVDNLSRLIFGAQWISKAEDVLKMQRGIRAKLRALESKDDSVEVKERAKGRDIIFLAERKEPQFVLAKSDFSVQNLKNGDHKDVSQNYEVKLRDINSSPKLYGKPTQVDVAVTVKSGPFSKASLAAYLDHVKKESVDKFDLSFSDIKASSWPMGIPRFFPLKMKQGLADAKLDLNFVDSDLTWSNLVTFKNVTWDFSELTQGGIILRAIKNTLQKISKFDLKIEFLFKDGKFKYEVSSDLDRALASAIKNAIGEQVAIFKKRLRADINRRVESLKKKALAERKLYEDQVRKKVASYQKNLKSYRSEADQLIKKLEDKAKNAGKKKAKEGIKNAIPKGIKKLKVPKLF